MQQIQSKRTKCLVYTRVMGYHRPVESFNIGKRVNINNASILKNMYADKPIFSITPFTLLDYPDKTACIIWFAGCNMMCVYCYNPEIVKGKGMLSVDDALNFLKSRINLIDAVVLSGGGKYAIQQAQRIYPQNKRARNAC